MTMPFPILEDKIRVLPHSCFVCSKSFVRKNTLLKHYHEHYQELGPNLEFLEVAKAKYYEKMYKTNTKRKAGVEAEYTAFQEECAPIPIANEHNSNQNVIQNLDSNDITITMPFPILEDKIKVLPHSCFICSKAFVRKNTLLKHYHEHYQELGPNLEYLEEAKAKYYEKKYKTNTNSEASGVEAEYAGFQEECAPIPIANEQNSNQNVIQNLDSNDIIITSLESSNIMVQNLDPTNIVQHIEPNHVNPEAAFSMTILSERETHECHVCGASFSAPSSLRRHSLIHMKSPTFTCDVCKVVFFSKNELDTHASVHIQPYTCWDCDKKFAKECDLVKHQLIHSHFTNVDLKCSICKIGFADKKSFKAHRRIHAAKKVEVCEVCNETFPKLSDLNKHYLRHSGQEPHICEYCAAGFFQKNALNLHFIKQHPHERKFVCYICIESFSLEEDLTKHDSKHRKMEYPKCDKGCDHTSVWEVSKKQQLFSCKGCSKKFSCKQELTEHKLTHAKKKIFVCDKCNNCFRRKDEYEEHRILHETEDEMQRKASEKKRKSKGETEDARKKKQCKKQTILCDICEESIDYDDFEDHMLMHNKGRMHTCRVCSQSFTFKEDLEAHSKNVHENGKPFSCPICNEGFGFKSDLREHKQIHNQKKTFSCKQCLKSFSEKSELNDHVKNFCKENLRHSCKACGDKFVSKVDLREHEQTHLDDSLDCDSECEDLFFVCKYCNKNFGSKSERSSHMTNCDKKKLLLCKNCNQRFKTKEELLEHKKVHSRRQPFICKVCNEGFKVKNDLEDHKKIHNTNPTYPCNICDKIFAQKESLREHKLSHKDEIVYICRVCDATFENKAEFKTHRDTHEVMIHQCKVCSETFSARKDLKRHYLKHILERPNLCRICNASFEQWGALRSHYLSHTRN